MLHMLPEPDLRLQDLIGIERELAGRSLLSFTRMAWPLIDPDEPYVDGWHMHAIREHLEAVASGEISRLLINVPPGTSKSTATCVYFPAWLWGPNRRSSNRFLAASFSRDNAIRDNRRCRSIIQSDWFQYRWGLGLRKETEDYFETHKGGFREATSIEGMTGKRGNQVVWDDPLSAEDSNSDTKRERANRIFSETLSTRLVNPSKSAIIIIMQRLHQNDVSGYILARELGYTHLMLPMRYEPERKCYSSVKPTWRKKPKLIEARYDAANQHWLTEDDLATSDPTKIDYLQALPVQKVYAQDPRTEPGELLCEARFPREIVDGMEKAMQEYAVAGQHQQRPVPRGGLTFKRSWFDVVQAVPVGSVFVRGWDLAGTKAKKGASASSGPARTASVLICRTPDKRYIICGCEAEQEDAHGIKRMMKATAARDDRTYGSVRGSLPQDPGSAGKIVAVDLVTELAGHDYHFSTETGDKESRAGPLAAQAKAGNVSLLEGPWNDAFLDELALFPRGKFKDRVDAASRAFGELVLMGDDGGWVVGN